MRSLPDPTAKMAAALDINTVLYCKIEKGLTENFVCCKIKITDNKL
jgi:hypothetical protein